MRTLEGWLERALAARGLTRTALLARIPGAERLDDDARVLALVDLLGIEGGATDEPSWWAEAVRRKDEMSLKDLADHLGVPVAQLTAEMRRRGIRRRVRNEEDEVEEDESDDSRRPERRTGSKDVNVEQYFHLLGKVPDSEVARMAGVSVRTIASYRARNEVPGYAGPRRRPAPRGRRQSKVDDFTELLGRVPDRVVADVAGMSLGAVRNYRIKHDIPAAGRMTNDEIARLVEDYRRGSTGGSLPVSSGWSQPDVRAGSAPRVDGGSRAWRCRLYGDAEGFIIVADSLRSAVERAVAAAGDESRIAGFEQLGQVLDLGRTH